MVSTSDANDLGKGYPSTFVNDDGGGRVLKRHRGPSAAQAVIEGDTGPIDTLESFVEGWKKIDGPNSEVAQVVTDHLDSLKYLSKYAGDNPSEDIDAIPLSSLDADDYARLNVHIQAAIPFQEFMSSIVTRFKDGNRGITFDEIFDCWEQNKERLKRGWEVILTGVPNKPEPFSRMLIDPILFLLVERINKGPYTTGVLFVEFPISKGSDHPTCIKYITPSGEIYTTFLTGRVDWLLLVLQGEIDLVDKAKDAIKEADSNEKADLRAFVNSAGIRAIWKFTSYKGIQAVVFEAKTEQIKSLIAHLPQVVGECLVTIDGIGREAVPWCLTTGETWIFGLAVRQAEGAEQRTVKYIIQHAKPISWHAGIETGTQAEVMEQVFLILAYWATMNSADITRVSQELSE